MNLPHLLAALVNGNTPQRESLFTVFKVAISVLAIVGLLVTFFNAPASNSGDDDGSSEAPPSYELPNPIIQHNLDELNKEFFRLMSETRLNNGATIPLSPWIERQESARTKAEHNAVTGTETPTEENVSMLQHHLPYGSSAQDFLDAWMGSEEHKSILLDPRHSFAAVASAYRDEDGKQTVYLVVQLERLVSQDGALPAPGSPKANTADLTVSGTAVSGAEANSSS